MTLPRQQLHPPEILLDNDIRWVLSAAFAEQYPPDLRPGSSERAKELIRLFSLISQVTSKLSQEQLSTALTPTLQLKLSASARRRTMRSLAVAEARERVCRAATEEGIGLVLLKQAALESIGLVTPGQRYATDVDVLLKSDDVSRLVKKLLRQGLRSEKGKVHAHGVVVLRTASNIGVELHTRVMHVRLPGEESSVDFESLKSRHLVRIRHQDSPGIWVPSISVVAAHLVVQGWYLFHFVPNAPEHKSPLRVIADLQYVGAHKNPKLAQEVYELIKNEVPFVEYLGLIDLAQCLATGQLKALTPNGNNVLKHVLSARLCGEYRHSLVPGRQLDTIRREGLRAWVRRQIRRAILPSREELEYLVESGSAPSIGMARLHVPWVLTTTAVRGAWAALRRTGRGVRRGD